MRFHLVSPARATRRLITAKHQLVYTRGSRPDGITSDVQQGDDADDWDEIRFVISPEYRIKVLETLSTGPSIPSTIASETGIPITHVSIALRALRERSLVGLLVSKHKKGADLRHNRSRAGALDAD